MKLFSLLPNRLVHLACNSPTFRPGPASQVGNRRIRFSTGGKLFFHSVEKYAPGFPPVENRDVKENN